MLFPCAECGKNVSLQAAVCPHCGYPVIDTRRVAKKWGVHLIDEYVLEMPDETSLVRPAECPEEEWQEILRQVALIRDFLTLYTRVTDPAAPLSFVSRYFRGFNRHQKPILFSEMWKL